MSKTLKMLLAITDILFITYWLVALAMVMGLVSIPPELMYSNYEDVRVIAWNWSFFPLDIVFSIMGLLAIRANRNGKEIWKAYAIVSLVLTMTAGGMAVSYWTLLLEFDLSWFLPNLALLIWPMFFLPGLMGGKGE